MCKTMLAVLLAAVSQPGIAWAQMAASQPLADEAREEPTADGDIIVTAQRRSQRLLEVPMSITAIQGEAIVNNGITSTVALAQISPGVVTVNNGFGFLPVIRGIQSTGTSPGDETNVAVYIDDVSIGTPIAGFFDLADIAQIEVLKGPQGTLYGRNATGGAIRIQTRKPEFETTGSISADYGFHYKDFRAAGFVTGKLADGVAGLLSATYRRGGGFIKGIAGNEGRTYGKPNNYVLRGKLLVQPVSSVEVVLAGDVWSQQNDSVFISNIKGGANPFPLILGTIPSRPYTHAGVTQPRADLKGWGTSVDAKFDSSGGVSVRSLTAYRHVEVQSQSDTDRTSASIGSNQISQRQDAFSEELIVASPGGQMLDWIVGAYYLNNKASNPYFRNIVGDSPGGAPNVAFTNHMSVEAVAGFGEVTLNPTPKLHLTGGLRYNSETKKFMWRNLLNAAASVTNSQRTWNSTTWRAVARYDLSDSANLYGSVSTGFKSGVYNAYSALDKPVNPEKITAFEIGSKARIGGINLTAAGYIYNYRDIQVSSYTYFGNPPALQLTLSNAASARMSGVEFSADGSLGGGFGFSAGFAWQPQSEYKRFTSAQVTITLQPSEVKVPFDGVIAKVVVPFDASGSRTVRSPEVTANARLTYEADLGGGRLNASVNGAYTSSFFWQPGNYSREEPYVVINFRLGWEKNGITYSLFGTNLTGSDYHTDYVPNVRGDSVKFIPRHEFGIGVKYAF